MDPRRASPDPDLRFEAMPYEPTGPTLGLVAALQSGERDVLGYLDELETRHNEHEPRVLSCLPEPTRFPRLRRQAQELLERYPEPGNRPPLFGVPIGVKDIFHVESFPTRAGSQLPPERLQGPEAVVVTLLRQAGALIYGKTVTTEFAYFAPGPTRNPHNPEHTPGGSSSGSAAAVAAGLCLLSLGTQTIGSIIRPAAFCGVVGYKPTYDRISREGVIPLAPSVDHIGLFAPDVSLSSLAAGLLCADWQPTRAALIGSRLPVLGVPQGPYLESASDYARHHFGNTCQRLVGKDFEIKFIEAMPDFDEIRSRHNVIVAGEAARVHAKWYSEYESLYHPKTTELVERGRGISESALQVALEGRRKLREELTQLMDKHGIDLWISPAAPGPAPEGLESTGDPVMNLPWTHSGLPTLNLPAGSSRSGLPMGLQVAGRWQSDETLLAWAAQLEPAAKPSSQASAALGS